LGSIHLSSKHLQILHVSDDLSNPGNLPNLPSLQLVFEQTVVKLNGVFLWWTVAGPRWNCTKSLFNKKTFILRGFNKWKQIDAKAWDSSHLGGFLSLSFANAWPVSQKKHMDDWQILSKAHVPNVISKKPFRYLIFFAQSSERPKHTTKTKSF